MTLKKIAEKAGVSVATVSYALNNTAPISEKTKQKILKIAKESGYTSNAIARSLRSSKTSTVGIIVEDLTVPLTAKIIDGINKWAENNGYNTILSNLRLMSKVSNRFEISSDHKKQIHNVLNNLISLQVDGIIYIGIHDRNVDGLFDKINKPFVYCYCYTSNPEDVCVVYDNENISYQLTRKFITLGHERIGVISGSVGSTPSNERMLGYKKAIEDAKLTIDPSYIKNGDWNFNKALDVATVMLSQKKKPTAIYAMNDDMAMGVYYAASKLGIKIPKELSVIGFDNADFTKYIFPILETVDVPLEDIGLKASEKLLKLINSEKIKEHKVRLDCELVQGESVAKAEK